MSDEAALLLAMRESPDDPLVRLAYADFLEETGGPEAAAYASLIREHVADVSVLARRLWIRGCGVDAKIHDHVLYGRLLACGVLAHVPLDPRGGVEYWWRWGFVRNVICSLPWWMENGASVACRHPVVRVELTDRRPGHSSLGDFYWEEEGEVNGMGDSHFNFWFLPGEVIDHVTGHHFSGERSRSAPSRQRGYPTAGQALAGVSAALLAQARQGEGALR